MSNTAGTAEPRLSGRELLLRQLVASGYSPTQIAQMLEEENPKMPSREDVLKARRRGLII